VRHEGEGERKKEERRDFAWAERGKEEGQFTSSQRAIKVLRW
jgi:hypothetical protein